VAADSDFFASLRVDKLINFKYALALSDAQIVRQNIIIKQLLQAVRLNLIRLFYLAHSWLKLPSDRDRRGGCLLGYLWRFSVLLLLLLTGFLNVKLWRRILLARLLARANLL